VQMPGRPKAQYILWIGEAASLFPTVARCEMRNKHTSRGPIE
jgi:hypothetical protein